MAQPTGTDIICCATADRSEIGQAIRARRQALAEQIVARQYGLELEQWTAYGDEGREKSVRDAAYHLIYLAEAISASDPSLFVDYVRWVRTLFAGLGFGDGVLTTTLDCTRDVLRAALPGEAMSVVAPYIEAGLQSAREAPPASVSLISPGAPMFALARAYLDALLKGERRAASRLILDALERGDAIQDIYLHVFQPVQREVGRLWQTNQVHVAQEHYITAATQLIMSQLYPYVFGAKRRGRRVVAACVGGELHEIGMRMVADFFEMEGWDTYYLGANTPKRAILHAIDEQQPDVLALSATMTFHISDVTGLIARVRAHTRAQTSSRAAARPYILVGGYPFVLSPDLWERVGADGYARDAQEAVAVANQWMDGQTT